MKKIIKKRGEGKTTELIKISHDTNTYILVGDRNRQSEVARMAHEMGLHIPYPVTIEDYLKTHFRGSFIKNILIDDADYVLSHIFYTVTIDAITMTEGEEKDKDVK